MPTSFPLFRSLRVRFLRVSAASWRMWLIYFPLVVCSTSLAVSAWDARRNGGLALPVVSDAALFLWLLGIAAGVLLNWRRSRPIAVIAAVGLVALIAVPDPTATLIAWASFLTHHQFLRRVDAVVIALGAFVFLTTAVATWRDGRGTTLEASMWRLLSTTDAPQATEPIGDWWVVAISLAIFITATAIAGIVRLRADVSQARDAERQRANQMYQLSDELDRRAQYERVAREFHDSLGHRLSVVSLHAGALRLHAGDNEKLARSAEVVEASTSQAVDELHLLLDMLRSPQSPDVAAAVPTLSDLPELIDESVASGMKLLCTATIDDADQIDLAVSRNSYRIVQELLTNARRHAPELEVMLRVRANSQSVTIEAANFLPTGADRTTYRGHGYGLDGIAARAEAHGGQFNHHIDPDGVFRVSVYLPATSGSTVPDDRTPQGQATSSPATTAAHE